jgi:hypothetical protein
MEFLNVKECTGNKPLIIQWDHGPGKIIASLVDKFKLLLLNIRPHTSNLLIIIALEVVFFQILGALKGFGIGSILIINISMHFTYNLLNFQVIFSSSTNLPLSKIGFGSGR